MTTKTITDKDGDQLDISVMRDGLYLTAAQPRVARECTAGPFTRAQLEEALAEVAPGTYTRHESPDYADGGVAAALIEKEAEQTLALAQLKALGDDGTALRCAVMIAQAGAGESTVAEFCRQIVCGDDVNVAARAEDAERMAVLWKEIAREHVRRTRTARGYIEALQGGIDMKSGRVKRAEENVRAREEMVNRLAARARKAEHLAKERAATIKEQAALIERLRTEQPQALAPVDVARALDAAMTSWWKDTPPSDAPMDRWKVKQAVWSALYELDLITPEPQRPEWADLADVLGDFAIADEHSGDRDDMILARRLHERGVRLVTEEDR